MKTADPYKRRALVRDKLIGKDLTRLNRYLPTNYEIVRVINEDTVEIAGHDDAGWTLDDYVIPRLWSGLIGCEEIHPQTTPDKEIA